MPLVTLKNIHLMVAGKVLFDDASLTIDDNERVCIVGRNGVGKSTLLKIIHGEMAVDAGEVIHQRHILISKLEQQVPENMTGTVREVIEAKLDKQQQWEQNHQIEDLLAQLSLNPEDDFASLSGGSKRRVLLIQTILLKPDILLLDEPTNHLDIAAIEWLENLLLKFSGSLIFITHDRSFLKKLATRIIDIDRGHISNYPGNYDKYLEKKTHELEVEQTHHKHFDKTLAQEEAWIRQGIKARRTRNEGRVRALKKLREQRQERRDVIGKANMQIQQSEQSGKLVIEAKNISYHYANKTLINSFSTTIMRGDKIGLIGPNGVGKTTLLKILLGELKPQQGTIKQGTKLQIAYFDQLRAALDDEKTVAENVSYGDQYVKIDGRDIHIMSYLQDFLFTPERARTQVKTLSGGERNRLLLARLFTQPANMLVLDEPTNDLDLETLELLEDLLVNYQGTLLLVSHDRKFLDNVVTSTIAFEGNGELQEYVGGYEEWLQQRTRTEVFVDKSKSVDSKINYKDQQKKLRALESKIEKLEQRETLIHQQLANNDLYAIENADKLQGLQNDLSLVKQELALLIEQWEELM